MTQVKLGETGIIANKNGFGALPIQRISMDEAKVILRKAYLSGTNFFDTGRAYTNSEEKIGNALSDVRDKIYISTKTKAAGVDEFWENLNKSLNMLKTDYIDILQFHNPESYPKPGDGTGLYEAMLEAKSRGMIRHIGITNHKVKVASDAAESGLYETIQFPFSYLATDEEINLVKKCKDLGIGFIAMKALSGGLITNSAAAYAYLAEYDNVLPIWGVQREKELDEFISYNLQPPVLNEELISVIEHDKKELHGEFCRGCGYCLPCPANIDIPTSARMSLMIRRAPTSIYLNEEWKEKMKRIDDCIHCNHCKNNCPYGLDTPELLKRNWTDYKNFI
ncbi:MAG: aldo/keto reductase [Sedimentibacter sp.]|jgi:predicted aldo/keto reductase-like oxidoreductase|nr:aldo/keto reductase [Sedimentibacter sp.]